MTFFTPHSAKKFLPKAYNSFAKDFSSTRHYQWKEFERLSETVPKTGNIIDLGCGNGRLLSFLQEKNFSGHYIGLDISDGLLEEARKQNENKHNKTFLHGGFLDFPEKIDEKYNENISQIWAVASFHHLSKISEREKTLENIWNILEENGEFICTVWNLWEQKKYEPQKKQAYWKSFLNPYWNKRDFIIPWGKEKTKRYYYSFAPQEIEQLLQENGFEIVDSFLSEKKQNICIRAKKIKKIKKFFVHSIPFHKISLTETIEKIKNWEKIKTPQSSITSENKIKTIFTPNPEMIMECRTNKTFEYILQNSDISLADGNGILWASGLNFLQWKATHWKWIIGIYYLFIFAFFRKFYNKKIAKPLCGSDLFQQYLSSAGNKKHIFLLGGMKGSAEYISEKYKNIISGYFDGMVNEENNKKIIENIKKSGASVLFVALGAPKQELWIHQNRKILEEKTNIKVALGVGGSFDFISGHQKRSPKIFRILGLEWAYRLWKQPERAGRIWTATGGFIAEILR